MEFEGSSSTLRIVCSPTLVFTDAESLDDEKIGYEIETLEENAAPTSVWSDANVKLLLSSVEELVPLVGKSRELNNKSKMWREITRQFNEQGLNYSLKQIMNKFTSLERQYKKWQLHVQIGRKRTRCPYQSELERIMWNQPEATEDPNVIKTEIAVEQINCNSSDSVANQPEVRQKSDTQSDKQKSDEQNSVADELKKLSEQKAENTRFVREMNVEYHKRKLEYLNRKKLHWERKEAYMARKEALLQATLIKLENKLND